MAVAYYSQTSRKGIPKMSSPGGHLREVAAHESLDDTGLNFASLAYGNCSDLCHAWSDLIMSKVNFEKSYDTSLWEFSVSCTTKECCNAQWSLQGGQNQKKIPNF